MDTSLCYQGRSRYSWLLEIKELETEGILKNQSRGNLVFYSINRDYPLYNEYRKIVIKTIGFEETLRNALKNIKAINDAYIYGSYAKNKMDTHSDIDLLVVGSHNIISLQKKLNKIQKQINKNLKNALKDINIAKKDKILEVKFSYVYSALQNAL